MKRAFRIIWQSMKVSLMMDLEYRMDFVVGFFQSLMFIAFNLLFYKVIIDEIGGIGDWGYWQMVLLFGTFVIVDGFFMGFIVSNINSLGKLVNTGALDLLLTKPIDIQFLISSRFLNYFELVSIAQGIIILAVAIPNLGIEIQFGAVLLYILMLACSVLLFYSTELILCSLVFFTERGDEIGEIIFSLKQFAKLPDVYKGATRYVFMFLVPIVFSSFVPAGVLTGHVSVDFLVYYLGITVFLLIFSRFFFKYCLSKYKSAGG